MNNMTGAFVISLDFELMWGVVDRYTTDGYGVTNVMQVKDVIPQMVEMFEEYNVHATFAIVGMLMLKDSDDVNKRSPSIRPAYDNQLLSPYYSNYIDRISSEHDCMFFAPELVEQLKKSLNVEIGTHTFCHYYCNERGQTLEQFEEDLKKAIEIAEEKGIHVKSIIFPRNMVSMDYLGICAKHGIETYRGNPDKFFPSKLTPLNLLKNRIGRLLDAYINIGGHISYSPESIDLNERPLNIKASRFFRPYNDKLSFLEPLRIKRIKDEMTYAAQHGEVYHLWWHPHNFGANMAKNMSNLRQVLECYKLCHERYGWKSCTMNELKSLLIG